MINNETSELNVVKDNESYRRAKEILESKGFVIFPIEPKSLVQLVSEDPEYFGSAKFLEYFDYFGDVGKFTPKAIEIAIDPQNPTIPKSFRRTRDKQKSMIAEWGEELKKETGLGETIEIRMAHVSEYAQADRYYQKRFGGKLFSNFYVRTLDQESDLLGASVGRDSFGDLQLGVLIQRPDYENDYIDAVPVVVLPPRK